MLNAAPFRADAKYVLYWAQVNRRAGFNHGLVHAVDLANRAGLPVLFYEGLTFDYPYASDRLHAFILEGVPDTQRELSRLGIGYVFYMRRGPADPNDVLYRLAKDAAALVTDQYPLFPARNYNASVPAKLDVPYYAVDSSCIVPMACFEKREYAAYTIRPKIKKLLPQYVDAAPAIHVKNKFRDPVPQFQPGTAAVDHTVRPSPIYRGGSKAAHQRLQHFLKTNLHRYADHGNKPSDNATSGLSPYLHFGHISALEVALAVQEYARDHKIFADDFLEELIVRRELAFNFARFTEHPQSLDALPDWAKKTLAKHARDKRDPVYSRDAFESAGTHDPLWNAAQRELLITGKIHGYYRMYWGKKIIEWSRNPEEALATTLDLNDRYALDGRDPNSYANILWCFGLHDRPWVERPIFGQIRYMSYEGMRRKTDVDGYVRSIEALG